MTVSDVESSIRTTKSRWGSSFDKEWPTFLVLENQKIPLDDAFRYLCYHLCSDPRDRLYGALQLIDWSSTTLGKIVPNYDLSVYDLALRVLPDIDFITTSFLVWAFEMGHGDKWVVQRRQERKVYAQAEPLDSSNGSLIPRDLSSNASRSVEAYASFVQIQCQVSGRLSAAPEGFSTLKTGIYWGSLDSLILTTMEPQPRKVFVNEEVKVLVCAATKPGDLLMHFNPPEDGWSSVSLVIRQRAELVFDIVGQAVCIDDIHWASGAKELRTARIDISLSLEDQLFLFAQDARPRNMEGDPDEPTYDIDVMLERLNTWVTASPEGAVRLVEKREGWD